MLHTLARLRYCVALTLLYLVTATHLHSQDDCVAIPPRVSSLLPNPSLEQFDPNQFGCASRQPGGRPDATNQANCLVGWQRVSNGTTDSWNAFTLTGEPPNFPAGLPQPLPSGTGVAGFWVGIDHGPSQFFINENFTIAERYREYLAACFTEGQRLRRGEDYRLTFHLGFIEPQEFTLRGQQVDMGSPGPVELAIYGVRECDQLHFGGYYDCPEAAGAAGYELITTVRVSGEPGGWTPVAVDFVPQYAYAGFAIGGSCGPDLEQEDGGHFRNYYFIDDLILNERQAFEEPTVGPISVEGQTICADTIRLTGHAFPGATYQWYHNDQPLAGATDTALLITPHQGMDGTYTLGVTTTGGCGRSEGVSIQRPVYYDQYPDSVAFCDRKGVTVYASRILGASYAWEDGSSGPSYEIKEEGTYRVTISTACEQRVEEFVAVATDDFPYTYVLDNDRPCPGDTVRVSLSSNWYVPLVDYVFPDGRTEFRLYDEPVRVVAGEVAELYAISASACGVNFDRIPIPALPPLEATAEVQDLNCHGSTGSIDVRLNTDAPARLHWTDPRGEALAFTGDSIPASYPGTYSLRAEADGYCNTEFSFKVGDNDNFGLDVLTQDVTCGGDGSLEARPRGGTPPYAIAWSDYPDGDGRGSGLLSGRLGVGAYHVSLTDSKGCRTEQLARITGPPPLGARASSSFTDCAADSTGTLSVVAWGGTPPYHYRLLDSNRLQSEPHFTVAAGTHRVVATDANGCSTEPPAVSLSLPPPVTLDLSGPQRLVRGEELSMAVRISGTQPAPGSIAWMPGAGLRHPSGSFAPRLTAIAYPKESTRYRVSFTSEAGCTYTDSLDVAVEMVVHTYLPNVFSPNGDGLNDRWQIFTNVGVRAIDYLQIFDRWGNMLWERRGEDAAEGWDGTLAGKPLNSAVYVYRGSLTLINGSRRTVEGTVSLLR